MHEGGEMRERRMDTGTVEINYAESQPNGPPFVVLHGGSASWRYGEGLIRLLARTWHVYAPDFRGHGKSGHVPGHYLLQDYAADTALFLQQAFQGPAVVYGHSLGGEAAIMVAAEHPGLVRAVIIGDAPLSTDNHPTERPAHRQMNVLWHSLAGRPSEEIVAALKEMPVEVPGGPQRRAVDAFGDTSPWFEFQAQNLHRLDPDMLAAVLAGPDFMLRGYAPEKLLPAITCPVLLLQSDPAAGGMLSDEDVDLGLRLLLDARHVRLEGIGHELHSPPGQDRRVFEAISPFLERL